MFRTNEFDRMNQTLEDAKDKQDQRTKDMTIYYKQECNKWMDAKNCRKEAFDFCKSR